MSEVDRIYQKYIGVFYEVDGGGTWIDLSAVRYALRAALRELAGPPTIDLQGGASDQHQFEVLAKQIERLNDWLFEHAPDLAHEPYTDTADAMIAAVDRLRGTVERMRIELAAAIDERNVADAACAEAEKAIAQFRDEADQANEDMNAEMREKTELRQQLTTEIAALRSQLAQMDADNAKLAQELASLRSWSVEPHGNGKSHPAALLPSAQSAQSADETPAWDDAMLTGLDPETHDYWHGIAAGRWTWRKLPKSTRLAMVRHVLSFGPEERAMSMSEFDAVKPHWMPGAGSHPVTFGVPWSTLSDMRVEIEVTP